MGKKFMGPFGLIQREIDIIIPPGLCEVTDIVKTMGIESEARGFSNLSVRTTHEDLVYN